MFRFDQISQTHSLPGISSLLVLLTLLSGCGRSPAFSNNQLFAKRLELEINERLPEQGLEDVKSAIELMFGTCDQPQLPPGIQTPVVSLDNLQRAAGRVYSDENDVHFGLYRNNCIRCHGTSGDGRGPAARLLSPYPRDFRMGKYKFKSTAQGKKPSRADLERTIRLGLPGTSMPSFGLLDDEDVTALVDYVIYLSVRGETERELLRQVANMLDYDRGERLFDIGLRESDPTRYEAQLVELTKIAANLLEQWNVQSLPAPTPPVNFPLWDSSRGDQSSTDPLLSDSIARGQKLFRGELASCSKCHGEDGTGKSAPNDYDIWTKDWTLAARVDPEDKTAIRPLLQAGAFKPVRMYPRNLNLGVFRGGSNPQDIYLRIVNGIEGTSMPAAAMQTHSNEGLSPDQVWDLVNYVLSLSAKSLGGESQ
jgi:mono/diheme cytochrome c family protein